MGLLDSILSAVSGKSDASGQAAPLIGILSGLLAQSGGLQGLASKFSQSGQGDAFSSWVGMGENQPVSTNQVQEALGSDQVRALAAKMGVDPNLASQFLAEYLPKIVDKLTPAGKVDPTADHQQGLAALLPSLLQSLGGKSGARSVRASIDVSAVAVGPGLYNTRESRFCASYCWNLTNRKGPELVRDILIPRSKTTQPARLVVGGRPSEHN